ncbi:MAG TPA: hypothetical protein DCY88_02305 [Cyanobacteria bacterium UBA11372]|nr:hypothetical protein [Cyanobacteria bacterium UBA11372]
MNRVTKLAATIGTALSCAVLLQVNQAKAATFSFTQGGYFFQSWFSPGNVAPEPRRGGLNFDFSSSNNAISGTFTGEDVNGDGTISSSEVSDFSLNFFGIIEKFGFRSFNVLTRQLSINSSIFLVREFPPIPCPVPSNFPRQIICGVPIFSANVGGLNIEPTGGQFSWSIFEGGINGYTGTWTARTFERPQVTEITQAKPVPEPEQNAITLAAVLGFSFLVSKKVHSLKSMN